MKLHYRVRIDRNTGNPVNEELAVPMIQGHDNHDRIPRNTVRRCIT